MTQSAETKQPHPALKFALELGPLLILFVTNTRLGLFWATAVFMVAVVISLVLSYLLMRRWPVLPVVSGIVVVVFGTLTLILQDEHFIKLKPTIVNLIFGTILLGGLAFGKPLLSYVFDSVFNVTEEGWRKLTFRWGCFFLFLAAVNELVWRTQTTDFWVAFKVFGFIPLGAIFAALQYPLLVKYDASPREEEPAPAPVKDR